VTRPSEGKLWHGHLDESTGNATLSLSRFFTACGCKSGSTFELMCHRRWPPVRFQAVSRGPGSPTLGGDICLPSVPAVEENCCRRSK
jgi:hypothetical protein